ncbi:hypothetical protein X801_06080, partial [Opisthorchis viverrini]
MFPPRQPRIPQTVNCPTLIHKRVEFSTGYSKGEAVQAGALQYKQSTILHETFVELLAGQLTN